MTTPENESTQGAELEHSQQAEPAPGAEDQKPNAEPASDADAEKTEESPEQQEAKRESRRQRSNARKAAALAEAKTEARLLRERVQQLEAQGQPKQEAVEPKREDFPDYETYLRAASKFDAEQAVSVRLKTEREANQGRERQAQHAQGQEKVAKAWTKREQTFQAQTKDYEDVVTPFVEEEMKALSAEARMAIVESDVGPALLYQLANLAETNPSEFERISGLSPVRQVAELGKIETKVSMPAKRTTQAPAPAKVTQGNKTAQTDPSKMDQGQYEKWRKEQGARFVN